MNMYSVFVLPTQNDQVASLSLKGSLILSFIITKNRMRLGSYGYISPVPYFKSSIVVEGSCARDFIKVPD